MLIDPATMAWVGIVAFFAAVIGGLGGFGTSVILAAVLTPIFGIKAVLPLNAHLHIAVIEGMLLIAALWLIVSALVARP